MIGCLVTWPKPAKPNEAIYPQQAGDLRMSSKSDAFQTCWIYYTHTDSSNMCNEAHIAGMQSICCTLTYQSHMHSSFAKKCIRPASVRLYLMHRSSIWKPERTQALSLSLFYFTPEKKLPFVITLLILLRKWLWYMGQNLPLPDHAKVLELSCAESVQQYIARYTHTLKPII